MLRRKFLRARSLRARLMRLAQIDPTARSTAGVDERLLDDSISLNSHPPHKRPTPVSQTTARDCGPRQRSFLEVQACVLWRLVLVIEGIRSRSHSSSFPRMRLYLSTN